MLNRRILRVKAMQAIYAFKQAKKSNFAVAQDFISDSFLPDLNSMEFQDKAQLNQDKKVALQVFEESYANKSIHSADSISQTIQNAVQSAISQYYQAIEKDKVHFSKTMLLEVESIYEHYISIFQMLVALAHRIEKDKDRKLLNPNTVKKEADFNFADNALIKIIENDTQLQNVFARVGNYWKQEEDTLKILIKELKTDETYQKYISKVGTSFEEDKQIIDYILRNYAFKKSIENTIQGEDGEFSSVEEVPFLFAFFEDKHLNWTENREVIKSMALKTLKGIEADTQTVPLVDLSPDWEIDKAFFIDLYNNTLNNEEEYEDIIVQKTQNWRADRLALVDKVLIKMAIAELVYCTSIPVKVTINEYIELSKRYSTPKSKQFVNGLLNAVAEDLLAQGKIKKSGRGLIDNK